MKRTLVEILCGFAVLVVLVSFHKQIANLRDQGAEVQELRGIVTDAVAANSSSREEIDTIRRQLLAEFDQRLEGLNQKVTQAERGIEEASTLRTELEATRRDADLLKAEFERDVTRALTLVDTYQREMRAQGESVQASISAQHDELVKLASQVAIDPERLTQEMLLPTVQLNGEDTVGSGTLVRSDRDPRTGKVHNYVLTSYHVVRNIFADSKKSRTEGIQVKVYGDPCREVRADMISYDQAIDAALLKLRTEEVFPKVARVLPRALTPKVAVWDEVYAIGCPLGSDPVPSHGAISSKENVLGGANYWMINAPTYYGNSGGGIYLSDSFYLVGVFSKIYTHGRSTPVVVPHMGLCTPIDAVYRWLEREQLGHVLPQPEDRGELEPGDLRYMAPTPGR